MDGLRERERGKSGESERLGEASAAQGLHRWRGKKSEGEVERERGNGWVERKRERKEWGVREVGRGECCTGAAQMVHSAVALIPLLAFTLRMKCGREGSWGREENEGEREVREGREKE
ncbi:uncharacterized protein MONOS_18353 [Monocercomonoides exilis]|uniref:uncharacterized protein n=1 Tax=Monocercomonoides exilis TaxID=2049356 RepID=UPI0035594183|nr:hypothetical protein MONOS_18353 [Monocercomonoides exilis]